MDKKFHRRGIFVIGALAIIAALALAINAGWESGKDAPMPDGEEGTRGRRLVDTDQTFTIERIWSRIGRALKYRELENPGADLNEELHARLRVTVPVQDVIDESAQVNLPFRDETEREDVLRRLRETEELFAGMIGKTEESIREALGDGSRSGAEIREAEQALGEMKKGRAFITGRISMVEEHKN